MSDKVLRDTLISALTGEGTHVSLNDAVKNVRADLRNVRPSENIHSVWELLEHIRIAQEDILKYTVDASWQSPNWPDGYWPDKNADVSEKMWNGSINKFENDLNDIVKLIKNTDDLTFVIPHTENHTYLREILLVIDHNSYHTAQIVNTRKLLNDW